MVQAILCLFLCLPTGIVAMVMASRANQQKAEGDYQSAINSANNAKTWCWVSLVLGIVGIIVVIGLAASGADDPNYYDY